MRGTGSLFLLFGTSALTLLLPMSASQAQTTGGLTPASQSSDRTPRSAPAAGAAAVEEVIVTANKRSENLQNVGLAVQAIGATEIANRRIASLKDIALNVPGLTFVQSQNNTPVYTMRGVGFFESSLSAYPDVSLYIDQAPLPFPVTATLAAFDLERLEALKGPQGTLFGNNATGGAVNFISAKPSSTFGAGTELAYSTFNTVDLSGHITGPVTDAVDVRFAFKSVRSDGWQQSYTRNDTLGQANTTAARLLIDWRASERLKISVNLNGWRDASDPQAPQYWFYRPQASVSATFPMAVYARSPAAGRAADWDSGRYRPRANNRMLQGSLRADYDLTDDITLTALASYISYRHDQVIDGDGTALLSLDTPNAGQIESSSEEVRLANASSNRLRWLAGANYEHSDVEERNQVIFPDATTGSPTFFQAGNSSSQRMRNYAAFANVEYDLTDRLVLKGGIRQTQANRRATNDSFDLGDGGISSTFTGVWSFYRQVLGLGGPIAPIPPGGSVAADPKTGLPGVFRGELNQSSTSWLVGANYRITPTVMLYANISKGFKAGSFPAAQAAQWTQYAPVVQEELLDYELGFKSQMFDRALTLNGAIFDYDYRNKQLRAKIVDPFFGILDGLVNVPKSTVRGAELEATAQVFSGLKLHAAATYLDSRVDQFQGVVGATVDPVTGFNVAVRRSLSGARLPNAPRWQAVAGFDYSAPISDHLVGFAGANASYMSSYSSALVGGPNASDFRVDGRTLVDVNVGVGGTESKWKLTLWGKNVFNRYYWTTALASFDNVVRYAGRPAEYGVTLNYQF